jgi:hypothetical protein
LSRLRILILSCTVLALAAVLAACGGGGGGSSENPQKVVDDATLKGVKSGNLDLSLGVNAAGNKGGKVDVSLSGPFQSQGGSQLPQLDMKVKASGSINGQNVNLDGGLTLLSDRAYVNYKGTEYEVDPTTFSFVKSMIQQAQQRGAAQGQSGVSKSCQNAVSGLKISDFVSNLSNDGSSDVGGTGTTHVSGDLNVSGAIDQVSKIVNDPACRSQLSSAGQLPATAQLDQAKSEISSAVKSAHVDLYVGDDNIVRRIVVALTIEPPAGSNANGVSKVDLSLDLTLTDVNKPQTITAPSGAKPLNDLFQQLGINPLSLIGPNGGLNGLSGAGGAGGLGGLLNGINGAAGGGSSGSGGGSGSSGGGGSGSQQAYLKCLQGATTPADLQKCASQR